MKTFPAGGSTVGRRVSNLVDEFEDWIENERIFVPGTDRNKDRAGPAAHLHHSSKPLVLQRNCKN